MEEMIKLFISVFVLILGFPIGYYLAKNTKEELKSGQRWFRLIVIIGLVGGLIGLILGNDFLMFFCFFVAIVTSRSLKN